MKTGKLSKVEQLAIVGALSDNMTIEEIAKSLDRSEKIVSTYAKKVKKEKQEKQKQEEVKSEEEQIQPSNDPLFAAVRKRLISSGLTHTDADRILDKFVGRRFKTEDQLFVACIKSMKAGDFMQKKSQGGREGIAIMNGGVSARLDEAKKLGPKHSRHVRGNIFKPKNNTYE